MRREGKEEMGMEEVIWKKEEVKRKRVEGRRKERAVAGRGGRGELEERGCKKKERRKG